MRRVCVFCGSSPGRQEAYRSAAVLLGESLVSQEVALVYGGACVGLMGTVADAVLANGGEAIGVIPASLVEKELAHPGLTELHVVETMHQRKATMSELSDGFIALPGGIGTLEEMFEALTWAQLGFHQKHCALLNTEGYYQGLVDFLHSAVTEGFVKQRHLDQLLIDSEPQRLLERMARPQPGAQPKWEVAEA